MESDFDFLSDGMKRLLRLECPACFKTVDGQPRMLFCGHSICSDCADQLAKPKESISCPSCHRRMTVPRDGLPTNFFMSGVLKQLKVTEEQLELAEKKLQEQGGNMDPLRKGDEKEKKQCGAMEEQLTLAKSLIQKLLDVNKTLLLSKDKEKDLVRRLVATTEVLAASQKLNEKLMDTLGMLREQLRKKQQQLARSVPSRAAGGKDSIGKSHGHKEEEEDSDEENGDKTGVVELPASDSEEEPSVNYSSPPPAQKQQMAAAVEQLFFCADSMSFVQNDQASTVVSEASYWTTCLKRDLFIGQTPQSATSFAAFAPCDHEQPCKLWACQEPKELEHLRSAAPVVNSNNHQQKWARPARFSLQASSRGGQRPARRFDLFPPPSPFSSSSTSAALPPPPPPMRVCYNCQQPGHRAVNCFKPPMKRGNLRRPSIAFTGSSGGFSPLSTSTPNRRSFVSHVPTVKIDVGTTVLYPVSYHAYNPSIPPPPPPLARIRLVSQEEEEEKEKEKEQKNE